MEKQTGKSNRFLPWILAGAVVAAWIVFYVLHIEKLLDAEMSGEMVLSGILAKEHGILTPNWYYPSDLRVLNEPLFFSLFLTLTGSFHSARLISGVVLLLLCALSYYYFCVQAGIRKMYPLTLALLFLPVSGSYAYHILYGLDYLPYVTIAFTGIAMMLHIRRTEDRKKKILLTAGLFVLSFVAGLGGARQLTVCHISMLLLFLSESIRQKKTELPGALCAFVGGPAGYAVNAGVLRTMYHFRAQDAWNFTGYSPEKAGQLLMGILHVCGYTEGPADLKTILTNICTLLLIGCLVHYYVSVFAKAKERNAEERILAKLVLVMTAVYFALYLLTDLAFAESYALLLTVFAAPLIGCSLRQIFAEKDTEEKSAGLSLWNGMAAVLGCVAVIGGGAYTYADLAATDKTSSLKEIVSLLTAQGYGSGYASYWNGNIVTELSEGSIEMFHWDDYVTEKIDVEELELWNQPVSHEEIKPAGKIFILLTTEEEAECPLVRYLTEEDEVGRNDAYVVYGFADYETMLASLSGFEYDLNDASWLAGYGRSEEGTWVLPIGAVAVGPNITLYTGDYEVLIEGSGIDRITYEVTAQFGESTLKERLVENDAHHMQIGLSVPENTYHVELRLRNITLEDIVITKIEIRRKGEQ